MDTKALKRIEKRIEQAGYTHWRSNYKRAGSDLAKYTAQIIQDQRRQAAKLAAGWDDRDYRANKIEFYRAAGKIDVAQMEANLIRDLEDIYYEIYTDHTLIIEQEQAMERLLNGEYEELAIYATARQKILNLEGDVYWDWVMDNPRIDDERIMSEDDWHKWHKSINRPDTYAIQKIIEMINKTDANTLWWGHDSDDQDCVMAYYEQKHTEHTKDFIESIWTTNKSIKDKTRAVYNMLKWQ